MMSAPARVCLPAFALVLALASGTASAEPTVQSLPYAELVKETDLFAVPAGAQILSLSELRRRVIAGGYQLKVADKVLDSAQQRHMLAYRQLLPRPRVDVGVAKSRQGKGALESGTESLSAGFTVDGSLPYGFDYSLTTPRVQRSFNDGETAGKSSATTVTAGATSIGFNLLRDSVFFEGRAALDAADLDQRVAELSFRAASNAAIVEAESAYFDIVERQFSLLAQRQALAASTALLAELKEMIRLGTKEETATLKVELQIAQNENDLVKSEAGVGEAIERLRDVLAIPDASIKPFPDPKEFARLPEVKVSRIEDSVAVARRKRPDLLQAKLRERRAAIDVRTARVDTMPALKLSTSATYGGSDPATREAFEQVRRGANPNLSVGLDFSMPLGDAQARAQLDSATIEAARSKEDVARLESVIRRDVATATLNLELGLRGADLARRAREIADLKLKQEYERFKLGESKIRDLTDAQKELDDARVNEIRARIGVYKAVSALQVVTADIQTD